MNFFKITKIYLSWHYFSSFFRFFNIWKNFLKFWFSFFSIKLLFRTFFSPFKRLSEEHSNILDFENFVDSFLINGMMRLFGMIGKTFIILIGFVFEILTIALGMALLLVWFFLPAILLILFFASITFIL